MTGLRLSFLGEPVVSLDGALIPLKPRKALALLVCLAVTSRRHSRDELAELLFPQLGRERARAGIRQCLSLIRRSLGDDLVQSDGDSVWLEPGGGFWMDVRETEKSAAMQEDLEARERLFRGEFLSGFFLKDAPGFDSWRRSIEESCRKENVAVLRRLTETHLAAREVDKAIDRASRWLKLDSTDEAAHRVLMESYALAGRRSEALRQYERCREILRMEVGAAPDEETEKLRQRIAEGRLQPRPSEGAITTPAATTPAAATPVSPPHNLGAASTAFIGREAELRAVMEFVRRPDLRLLTITGSAGTGKTRLAVEAARRLIGDFASGVFFVDLAPLRDPSQVVAEIGSVLGVADLQGTSAGPFERVSEFLRSRKLLLVLDNFEHLLDGAQAVGRLLATCPGLTVLATSREALKLQAENDYLLSPLPVNEAVELFVDRARAARHEFALSSENRAAVTGICTRLDGLPLAIELAAGRARFLPPGTLLSMLETRGSSLLSGGYQDMPGRHQTLWGAIQWSYALLTPPEQMLLRRLAVFRGGFTLDGAQVVCGAHGGEDVLRSLESLVEKNLISRTVATGEPWYVMFVPIREFSEKRLEESGEDQAILLGHARYYMQLAENAEPVLDTPAGLEWSRRLDFEYNNIRSAVEWSIGSSPEIALRIPGALQRYLDVQGHWRDAYEWLQAAISKAPQGAGLDPFRAKALGVMADSVLGPMGASSSVALAQQSVSLWRRIGDARGLAHALLLLGIGRSYSAGSPDDILPLLEESISLLRGTGDTIGISHAMFWQAYFTYVKGGGAAAKALAQESREYAKRAHDVSRHAAGGALLGLMAVDGGDLAAAQALVTEGLALIRNTADLIGIFYLLCSAAGVSFFRGGYESARAAVLEVSRKALIYPDYEQPIVKILFGLVALREGRSSESLSWFREGVGLLRESDYPWARQCLCACLTGVAGVRELEGHPVQAAKLLGSAASTMEAPYFRLAWGHDFTTTPTLIIAEYQRITSRVRSALGEAADKAIDAGRALTMEAAAALALTDAAAE